LKKFCNSAAGSGGPVLSTFLQETGHQDAPAFVLKYRECLRLAARRDAEASPVWVSALLLRGYGEDQACSSVHYLCNNDMERKSCEVARHATRDLPLCWISLESDGQVCMPTDCLRVDEVLAAMGTQFSYKPYRVIDDIIAAMKLKYSGVPGKYFGITDPDWENAQFARTQGVRRLREGEGPALTFSPWLPNFILPCGRMFADVWRSVASSEKDCAWWVFSEGRLWKTVPDFVARTKLCTIIQSAVAQAMRIHISNIPANVANGKFTLACLKNLDCHLYDAAFLKSSDGPATRFFVQFSDGVVLDRRTHLVSDSLLDMYISKHTGYPFPHAGIQAITDRLQAQGLDLESIIRRAIAAESADPFTDLPADVSADLDRVAVTEGHQTADSRCC
jgi:hypothetical protein